MLKQVKPDSLSNIRRHLLSTQELIKITSQFDRMHIDYVILKGIPLNALLYGEKLVRVSRDIDVLIHINDIQTVHHYLLTQGYQYKSAVPIAALTLELSWLTQYMDEVLYWHPDKNISLDVKWHISTLNCLDMSWCDIKDHTMVLVNEHPICTLNPAQNFYYLTIHAAKHGWERRQWLEDLAIFSQKIPFCWETVCALAQKTQAVRSLLEARLLLQQHFHIQLKDIPHSFWDKIGVYVRLYIIKSKWFDKLAGNTKMYSYLSLSLILFLLPKLSQKYHYMKGVLILRVASLNQVSRCKKPTFYKMIWFSFWPFGMKSK